VAADDSMKLAVLEMGAPAASLRVTHGTYGQMFARAFREVAPAVNTEAFAIWDGAPFPTAQSFDAIIVSGSAYGLYEDRPFIPAAEAYVRHALAGQIPVVGICFGHQLMAQALGGAVVRSDKGWGVGVHCHGVETSMARTHGVALAEDAIRCIVSHRDQVVALSPEITRLGGSDFCPNGVLSYAGGAGLSFQMHPEFTTAFARALLKSRRADIPASVAKQADQSFGQPSDRKAILTTILDFVRQRRRGRTPLYSETAHA